MTRMYRPRPLKIREEKAPSKPVRVMTFESTTVKVGGETISVPRVRFVEKAAEREGRDRS